MKIPENAEVFAVRCGASASPVNTGDIVRDHDNGCWKFVRLIRGQTIYDCQVVCSHAVSGIVVTTTPAAFDLKIVWEVKA